MTAPEKGKPRRGKPVRSKANPAKRGVGRPRGKNRDAVLARILEVARKHFAEKGFAQTTLIGIGHEAGMTHTALYSYVDSKVDLYLATLVDAEAQFLPDFSDAMKECTTLRQRFRRIAQASVAAYARDRSVSGFLAALPIEMRRHPELNAALEQQNSAVYRFMSSLFDEAKRNGEIAANASTINLASAFFGGMAGVVLFQLGAQAPSLASAMEAFLAMIDGDIFDDHQ